MSKPSRLAKPFKQSSGRKEAPGDRSRMLVVGERLMRAGSEGNLNNFPPQKPQRNSPPPRNSSPVKSDQRLCCPEDVDTLRRLQSGSGESNHADPWSPRTVPRRHTVGGPRSARDVLTMQTHSMDHKREAFLEHLKQKYPHHASAIMGHQERLRDQIRSPVHAPNPQPCVGDQGDHLALVALEPADVMSEAEAPTPFTRGSRSRASLPVVRSTNQTKDRSLGVLYLQYGEETKQIRMPNEVTSVDTIRALFVSAFPQQLNMKILESPNVAIYIKDDVRNMYYELSDVRSIMPHSCLKVYSKDPAQAFNHNSRANNGDIRIQRERLYSGRDGQHILRQHPGGNSGVHTLPHSPIHAGQGSMSPPAVRSVPSSPSRIPYGPRNAAVPGSATLPRDRLSSVPAGRSNAPCPSAILERRDVKPDDDVGGKGVALYADPYSISEARLSIASSQGTHVGDVVDGAGYLHRRSSVKSTSSYAESQEQQQHSLYRQKSRKYSDNPLSPLATPPPSPHRGSEVRVIDVHPGQGVHMPPQGVSADRSSSLRRSFRKDGNGGMEVVARARGNVASPVFADLPPGHGERPFQGQVAAGDAETSERMKAMEQEIARLTGLVQHALLKGPSTAGSKETASEKSLKTASPVHSVSNFGTSPGHSAKISTTHSDAPAVAAQVRARDPAFGSALTTCRKNVSDLRLQLHQLRQMQLQNQEAIRVMMRRVEQEIAGKVTERLQLMEDPVHKQRSQVDEERHSYLAMEEGVLLQLGELENYVEKLKRESTSVTSHRPITLRDVEEGAVNLRKVGEALAALKGEYPALQTKMRAVLRVEVEAVRFLKEEPHKMDSMLKRVKALTETLSGLRRCASEGLVHQNDGASAKAATGKQHSAADEPVSPGVFRESAPTPVPRSPSTKAARSEVAPSSPLIVQRVHSAPVNIQPCQHSIGLSHHASPPLTPTHGRDSPTVAKVSPQSREGSPALQKRGTPRGPEAPLSPTVVSASGAAPPLSQTEETVMNADRVQHPTQASEQVEESTGSTALSAGEDMEIILQQTQASLMEAIPDLEVPSQAQGHPTNRPTAVPEEVENARPLDSIREGSAEPRPVTEKPAQGGSERPQKPAIEKPHRPSVDQIKSSPEKSSKSPPPPPPRRFYPPGTGITTGRSGEVVYGTRRESTTTEEGEEEPPQPKPLRIPPEVKPKPHTPPPVINPQPHEEQDEADKIMAELQVFQKCPVKELEPKYVVDLTSSESPFRLMEPKSFFCYDSETVTQLNEEGKQTESGKDSLSPSSRVIFCLTGTAKPSSQSPSTAEEDLKEDSGATVSSTKVAQMNASELLGLSSANQIVVNGSEWSEESTEKEESKNVIMRSIRGRARYAEDAGLSPDLPGEEGPPPADNIAFMITNTKVQALSTGEYQELVSTQGKDVQTVKVGSDTTVTAPEDCEINRKPVIIIFDEPMEIRQAYKRLSTIFECEEELDRMLAEEKIEEENEEEEEIISKSITGQVKPQANVEDRGRTETREKAQDSSGSVTEVPDQEKGSEGSAPEAEDGSKTDLSNDAKQDAKKKFKFKFPKKQLAALGQALRTGTKTGKKTLQVVVYEDEEEADGTVREFKETKRFEIQTQVNTKSVNSNTNNLSQSQPLTPQNVQNRTEELRKTTYKTLDNLEETLKQLEDTISDMDPALSCKTSRTFSETKRGVIQGEQMEGSPSKRPSPLAPKSQKAPQHKKPKVRPQPRASSSSSTSSTEQNSSSSSDSSNRTVASSAKSRKPPPSPEKPGKSQKLQDSQRQFRQANGSADGDSKHSFLALPASKIPAYCPGAGKASSLSVPNSNTPKPTNPSSSSPSSVSSKSSIPCLSLSRPAHTPPSFSNDPPCIPAPAQRTKGHSVSLSPPARDSRPHPLSSCSYTYSSSSSSSSSGSHSSSSSSVSPTSTSSSSSPSSPSLLSPTAVSQGGRGGRALHVAGFSNHRPHQSGAIPPTPSAKDMA
ncbi:sickle tail protein homolog [Chanos chanos]|uniref:Sickle tail protein homolog n=1 Tax=Chanos chanos TaxID=29144 RepID=A0A6J2VC80_CHACN|nr:sickle tail protein homolog [Chanos chanos]